MHLSQTKAAKLAGVSRGTVANRIEAGALSCTSDGIDPAELVRVFDIDACRVERYLETGEVHDDPPAPGNDAVVGRSSPVIPGTDMAAIARHAEWLQGLVDDQRAVIARKDAEMRDALDDANARAELRESAWRRQVETLTALLPAPAPVEPEPRGFWRRVFG